VNPRVNKGESAPIISKITKSDSSLAKLRANSEEEQRAKPRGRRGNPITTKLKTIKKRPRQAQLLSGSDSSRARKSKANTGESSREQAKTKDAKSK